MNYYLQKIKLYKMKKILSAAIFLIINSYSFSQIKKAELTATGLTCSMCSNAINKAFKALPEVETVDIDLNKNLFIITLKKGNTLTPKTFKDKVEKAGFFIGSLILTMPFDNFAAADNSVLTANNATYTFIDSNNQILKADKKVKVLDKGFVTQKEYKKLTNSLSKYPSYVSNKDGNFNVKAL
jgi:copper chaperone CopZ